MSALREFIKNAYEAGAEVVEANTIEEATREILEFLKRNGAKRVALQLREASRKVLEVLQGEYEVLYVGGEEGPGPGELDGVDAGICHADYAVAETGTLILATRSEGERLASALPLISILLVDRRNVVGGVAEAREVVRALLLKGYAVSFVTGPSKTGDIELRMVKGVHGPHKVMVVVYGT